MPELEFFKKERERMVTEQIERRGVRDARVLAAMRKVPRHSFISEELRDLAYDDEPLSIGYAQTISQPYIVAYMTEILKLRKDDRVLEIGTGSGYQTAILAELASEVFTVELVKPLAGIAEKRLQELGYANIRFRIGNGWNGWSEEAPFDKVIVTAAPEEIPQPLIDQLKERGRLVIPVGLGTQELIEGEKRHGILEKDRKIAVRFVPLVNSAES
jgi:protein-L-isoaspartate(D-aspartate) O-methyltransferase